MKKFILLGFVVSSLFYLGCSDTLKLAESSSEPSLDQLAFVRSPEGIDESQLKSLGYLGASPASATSQGGSSLTANKLGLKVVHNASVELTVDNTQHVIDKIETVITSHNGYISGASESVHNAEFKTAQLAIKIPADRFTDALKAIKTMGEVVSASTSTQDVTKEYADIETRLSVKEHSRDRLLNLLKNQTGNLTDVLKVEGALEKIVTNLESIKGEKRYYDHKISMSTIHVQLSEEAIEIAEEEEDTFAATFHRSITTFGNAMVVLLKAFILMLPWLGFAVIFYFGVYWIRRFYNRKPNIGVRS